MTDVMIFKFHYLQWGFKLLMWIVVSSIYIPPCHKNKVTFFLSLIPKSVMSKGFISQFMCRQCYYLNMHTPYMTLHFIRFNHEGFTPGAPGYASAHAFNCKYRQTIIYSWSRAITKYVEQEGWRTLVKIRCIIQIVLLFGFPEIIQLTGPIGGF